MKINMNAPYINKETNKAGDQREKAAQTAPDAAKTEESKNDVVRLSDRSRLIAKATELAANAPDIRADKVNDLKARIGAGTYSVSGQMVADSLIRKSITEVRHPSGDGVSFMVDTTGAGCYHYATIHSIDKEP